jgi:hypothetical protein
VEADAILRCIQLAAVRGPETLALIRDAVEVCQCSTLFSLQFLRATTCSNWMILRCVLELTHFLKNRKTIARRECHQGGLSATVLAGGKASHSAASMARQFVD